MSCENDDDLFVRDGIELEGYIAKTELSGAMAFGYRPIPPKAAEIELHTMNARQAAGEVEQVFDSLVDRFAKHVTRWPSSQPINKVTVAMLKRDKLWQANRIILGTAKSDPNPNAKKDDPPVEDASDVLGK